MAMSRVWFNNSGNEQKELIKDLASENEGKLFMKHPSGHIAYML